MIQKVQWWHVAIAVVLLSLGVFIRNVVRATPSADLDPGLVVVLDDTHASPVDAVACGGYFRIVASTDTALELTYANRTLTGPECPTGDCGYEGAGPIPSRVDPDDCTNRVELPEAIGEREVLVWCDAERTCSVPVQDERAA